MARLIVVKGFDSGKEIEIGESPVSIGHSRDRDLFLQDDRVSRLHATAERREGRTVLRDMNSSNGTYVNDEYILEILLQHNDLIVMGDTHLKYVAEGEEFPLEKKPAREYDEDARASSVDETALLPGADEPTNLNISIDDELEDIEADKETPNT